MGMEKHHIERLEEYRQFIFRQMVEIGALKVCDYHDDYYYNTHKLENDAIYGMVTEKVKKKYGEKSDFKFFHEQIADFLKYAGDSAGSCPYCGKIEKE